MTPTPQSTAAVLTVRFTMLLGRGSECARVEALVDRARGGRSGALVIRGGAGVGKSALCEHAIAHADGATVVTVRSTEPDVTTPFAGLHGLVRRFSHHLDRLPEVQRRAVEGALGVHVPVHTDRFLVGVATLSLLEEATASGPLVVVFDDLQWLDPLSRFAVLFTAHRLDPDRALALLLVEGGVGPRTDLAGLDELVVGDLGDAATELVLRATEGRADPRVARRIVAATGGNPLAVLTLLDALDDAAVSGEQPLPDPLPIDPRLRDAYLRRVASLSDAARQALLIAAIAGEPAVPDLEAALAEVGLDLGSLEPAEADGFLHLVDGRLRFHHPLSRAAVVNAATPTQRRVAHRVLADTIGDPVRRAWHGAWAAQGVDEPAAAQLEAAAEQLVARGGAVEAARALEVAAGLTADGATRSRRVLAAAGAYDHMGDSRRSLRLVARVIEAPADPGLHTQALLQRGLTQLWSAAPVDARRTLIDVADRLRTDRPDLAAIALCHGALSCMFDGRVAEALELTEQAFSLVDRGPRDDAGLVATSIHAIALTIAGRVREAEPLTTRCRDSLSPRDALHPIRSLAIFGFGHVAVALEEYDAARTFHAHAIALLREQGLAARLPSTLAQIAEHQLRAGRMLEAYSAASEAVRLSEEAGHTESPHALVVLARVEAIQGQGDDCRAHVAAALKLAEEQQTSSVEAFGHAALGLLALAEGDLDTAASALDRTATKVSSDGMEDPLVIPYAADHVTALRQLGRHAEADAALARLERQVTATGSAWGRGAVARCRGAAAADDDLEVAFAEAVEAHTAAGFPFALGRTWLDLGARRRRAGRRQDARDPLHQALEVFEELRARPWADRARAELRATGERGIDPPEPSTHELTPQELQIALLVSDGATNKEAAAALFLSPKTVENHLSRVYAKLGVRSRTELSRRLRAPR